MITWILAGVVVFEFFFALDCFKRMLRAQRESKEKELDLIHTSQLVKMKTVETNYLRGVLDNHGIEWESGWRKLS